MSLPDKIQEAYTGLLLRELVPAYGCTEPAAIAYASAVCRKQLGEFPVRIKVSCSGNLFKNAKSVIVPNTNRLKGIAVAAICGVISGKDSLKLEILNSITDQDFPTIQKLLTSKFCEIGLLDTPDKLHIIVDGFSKTNSVQVEICREHTHIVKVIKNGVVVFDNCELGQLDTEEACFDYLNVKDIYQFAQEVNLSGELGEVLRRQVEYNVAICEEGLQHKWGACVGKLLTENAKNIETLACAFAAAGSDARMSGCSLPVVINSGSGNQGITITAPVYIYAKALKTPEEQMLRALALGNLISLYQKSMIGKLSAYCGAVSAGSAAGAAIAFLRGASSDQVAHSFANSVSCVSGILCDGAKPSCAAKIACSVQMGILAQKMALTGNNLLSGDGIVGQTPDSTIQNVGVLAKKGLQDIDQLILDIMYGTLPDYCQMAQ